MLSSDVFLVCDEMRLYVASLVRLCLTVQWCVTHVYSEPEEQCAPLTSLAICECGSPKHSLAFEPAK